MAAVTVGFGGGCHWCTEAVFQALAGVGEVRQGFIRSDPPDADWSEAVEVVFDPDRIGLNDLVCVHIATHASTARHRMRGKYRSAIYAFDAAQAARCRAILTGLARPDEAPFVTRVLLHRGFRLSDPRARNYYQNGPERPFCQSYIEPKLAMLRQRFAQLMRSGPA